MELFAVVLMLGSALGVAVHGISRRWLLHHGVLTVHGVLVSAQTITFVFWLFYVLFLASFNFTLRKNESIFWLALIITVGINIFIQYANAKASFHGEASLTAPIQSLTPGLVTIPALAFGEWPSYQGWFGILLIMVGNFIHAREGEPLSEWWKVFAFLRLPSYYHSLSSQEQKKARDRCLALRWSYGSALGGVIGLVFDSILGRRGESAVGIAWKWLLLASIFSARAATAKNNKGSLKGEAIGSISIGALLMIALCGLSLALGDGLAVIAFRLAPIAYIGSLKRLSIVLTTILSLVFLREQKAVVRLFPSILVTIGAALLALDGIAGVVVERVDQLFR